MPVAGLVLSGNTLFGTAGSAVFSVSHKRHKLHRAVQRQRRRKATRRLGVVRQHFLRNDFGGRRCGRGNGLPGQYQWNRFCHAPYVLGGNVRSGVRRNYYTNADGSTPTGDFGSVGRRALRHDEDWREIRRGDGVSGSTRTARASPISTASQTAWMERFRSRAWSWRATRFTGQRRHRQRGTAEAYSRSTRTARVLPHLHDFSVPFTGTNSDGSSPQSGLVLGGGVLYGTTSYGGPGGGGTLFKINTNGTGFSAFLQFQSACPRDQHPRWGPIRLAV